MKQPAPVADANRDEQKRRIYDRLRDLDPLQLVPLYIDGTDLEREVMEQAPRRVMVPTDGRPPYWAPFIDPELANRSVSQRAEAAHPELAAELRDLGLLRAALASLIASARTALKHAVPSLARATMPVVV